MGDRRSIDERIALEAERKLAQMELNTRSEVKSAVAQNALKVAAKKCRDAAIAFVETGFPRPGAVVQAYTLAASYCETVHDQILKAFAEHGK